MLLIYGAANIIGNIIAGKILAKNAIKSVATFPFALGAVYIILFLIGHFSVQYWITSAAPEAPEFANGLFLTSANLGTTIGTTVCGLFISGIGLQYVVFGGFLFLILSTVSIFLRNSMYKPTKQFL